jgi:hypothetical protein
MSDPGSDSESASGSDSGSDPGLSVWELMAVDPAVPIDRAALWLVISDQRRWSRTYVYPWLRVVSRVLVTLIACGKRACPVRFAAHGVMDRLCLWFLRRFVSPDAVSLLVRHFIVETNLLNFCLRNALPYCSEVTLRPATLAGLGDRAVIEHDLNVYRVLSRLGLSGAAGVVGVVGAAGAPGVAAARDRLDFGMLDIPPVDPEAGRRRLLNLDIQTALCLMNIPFALCLTPDEYRRAVHSLRLDASLLTVLASLTGDDTFLSWRPGLPPVRVDSNVDVPAMVYQHAVLCEYAHARLRHLGDVD